jgi:hypothetical protein
MDLDQTFELFESYMRGRFNGGMDVPASLGLLFQNWDHSQAPMISPRGISINGIVEPLHEMFECRSILMIVASEPSTII